MMPLFVSLSDVIPLHLSLETTSLEEGEGDTS